MARATAEDTPRSALAAVHAAPRRRRRRVISPPLISDATPVFISLPLLA